MKGAARLKSARLAGTARLTALEALSEIKANLRSGQHWTAHLPEKERAIVREFAVLHGTTHKHLSVNDVKRAMEGQGITLPINSKDAWLRYVKQVVSGEA